VLVLLITVIADVLPSDDLRCHDIYITSLMKFDTGVQVT
jgi:hypothetical protein